MDAAIDQYAPTETHNDTPTVSLSLPYGLHPSCLHMHVRSGSNTKHIVQFVIRQLISSDQNSTNIEQVTWNAFGDGYKHIEQIWQPANVDVESDTLKVAYRECIQNNSTSTSTITPDSLNRSNSKEVLCPRPWSYVDQRSYGALWRIIYWISQFLISIVLPFMQSICQTKRLESLVDEVSKLCLQIKFNDSEDYRATAANELTDLVTEKQLIKLHGLLKKNTHIHHRVQASWINMIHEAFYIEDVLNNENNTNHSIIKQSPLTRSWLRQKLFDEHPVLEWYIFFLIRPWALRILAIS
ncbi:unnamed protein product [Rotaria magnacalcarata]